jgi:Ca2+-binding RTX toxin-like protein
MAILLVPSSYATIADALTVAVAGDEIVLSAGYGPEAATVTVSNVTITGPVSAAGIDLTIGAGVTGLTLTGDAPINVTDSNGDDTITGNDGDNTITVTGGIDTVDGGAGNDLLVVDYSSSTGAITVTAIAVSGGGDSVSYTSFDNYTILTGSGIDTITMTVGDNHIDAGDVGANAITVGSGNNTIISGSGIDSITAGDGDNNINAGAGADTISVGSGDNYINVGAGADTITVGSGSNYIDAGDGINIISATATGLGENIVISGDGADTISLGGGDNHVFAGGGANIISTSATGLGSNTVSTGDDADTISLGDGDNRISAGGGANIITAGSGNNHISAGDGADTINASGGNNFIEAGIGANIITTTSGNDVVTTGNAADTVITGAGDDIIRDTGGAGAVTAGAGHDRLVMDFSAQAPSLTNTLTGAGPTYGGLFGGTTYDGVEEFHITGGSGNDIFTTGDGADVLDGGAGADTLTAGGGSDVIYGTAGDVIVGGEDTDGVDFDVLVLDGPGTVTFDSGNTKNGTVTLDSGGTVTFEGIESVVFDATTVTTLEDTSLLGDLGVTVTTFDVGNITYTAGDTASRTEGDLTINGDGTYTFTPAPNYNGRAPVISYTDSDEVTTPLFIEITTVDDVSVPPMCFVQGTLIETANGDIAVENLKVGDLVQTLDRGLQPLRWMGRQHLSARDLAENENMRPIRIRKDVINAGNGVGDLIVSPQHRILVASKVVQRMFECAEVLISAKQLLVIDGVDIANDFEDVTYFHILFDQHEIVYANGVPSESLYLGQQAQKYLSPEGREEIYTLFPEVASPIFMATSCRPIIQNKQARQLALRHAKNNKPLLSRQAAKVSYARELVTA